MQPLTRTVATTAATIALAVPTLSACGFEMATDRVYTPAAGTNDRAGQVDVLGAVVVSTNPGSGTFIASLSNNSTDEAATLEGLSGEGVEAEVEPVEIPEGSLVNLAEPPAEIEVTGDLEAGDFLTLTLDFGGERTEMEVPVVPNADDYAGLDGPAPPPSETPSPEHSE